MEKGKSYVGEDFYLYYVREGRKEMWEGEREERRKWEGKVREWKESNRDGKKEEERKKLKFCK